MPLPKVKIELLQACLPRSRTRAGFYYHKATVECRSTLASLHLHGEQLIHELPSHHSNPILNSKLFLSLTASSRPLEDWKVEASETLRQVKLSILNSFDLILRIAIKYAIYLFLKGKKLTVTRKHSKFPASLLLSYFQRDMGWCRGGYQCRQIKIHTG